MPWSIIAAGTLPQCGVACKLAAARPITAKKDSRCLARMIAAVSVIEAIILAFRGKTVDPIEPV